MNNQYRPDIDGLRALAVVAVIAFHAFPGRIPGGFVGVDVFFVISGYLITSIIYREITAEAFSIVDFYARRIRRIFPALIVVLLVSLIIGLFVLLPEEYSNLAKHVISGTLFYSNLLLWSEAGYFDVDSQLKPLMHLWSLGVEEQYYLLWPLALIGLCKIFRNYVRIVLAIVAIAAVSFALNIFFISENTTAVFYSPATRVWELLLGAMLAVREGRWPAYSMYAALYRNVASVGGCMLIVASVAFLRPNYPFPGWIALVPTIGTVLLISAGPVAWINARVFASRPVVFVGLISYPLYLWHWPLLSYVHIYEPEIYSPTAVLSNAVRIRSFKIIALLVAIVAAILTYQLIEKRVRRLEVSERSIAIKLIIIILMVGVLGGAAYFTDGLAKLRGPHDGPSKSNLVQPNYLNCVADNGAIFNDTYFKNAQSCNQKEGARIKLDILIFGDSHGMDLYRGIYSSNLSLGLFEANGCMPFPGFVRDEKATCTTTYERFMNLVATHRPSTIVISLYFTRFYTWYGKRQNLNALAQTAFKRLSALSDLVVMLDVPILNFNPDNCRSRPIRNKVECAIPIEIFANQKSMYEEGLRDASNGIMNIKFLDPQTLFCSGSMCNGAKDNILLYRDTHHLTNEGSVILGNWFWENHAKPEK